jgi:hypothetical protein
MSDNDELRERIKRGFKSGSKPSRARAETPHHRVENVLAQEKPLPEPVPEIKSEAAPKTKRKSKAVPKKEPDVKTEAIKDIPVTEKQTDAFPCYVCDKMYKTKAGVLKHMSKCMKP